MTLQSNKSLVESVLQEEEIIFIDPTVEDYESLIAGINPYTKVVILDRMKDGISQITENLQGGTYKAVHIVSHGSEGSLQLGSKQLNSSNLDTYKSQLQQWAKYLTDEADILLYGCDVAVGETGVRFVQQLSQLTGADVAASNDLTGSAAFGGDWDLEVKTGKIEAPLAFQVGAMEVYNAVLAAFTPGNLVVVRVGDGSASLSNAATAVFLDEFTPNGALVQSIALPTSDIGSNQTLTLSGTATSEGLLNLSPNGQFLTLAGYDVVGTASVSGTTSNAVNRIVARVDAAGNIDTTTRISDAYSGSNIRSAVTDDGTRFWTAGGTSGTRSVALGSAGSSTSINSSTNNTRFVSIFGSQLYTSTITTVNTIGTGLPTTNGQASTSLSGVSGLTNAYSYVLLDRDSGVAGVDTLYVADQSLGLFKYSFNGTTWTARGNTSGQFTGLTGIINANTVDLYATSGTGAKNTFVRLTDTAAFNADISASIASLASAGTNTAFRGIAFASGTVASPTNLASVINLPSTALSYAENTAPIVIDSTATVSDLDSSNFNTGKLIVDFASGGTAFERLAIRNQGISTGEIGLDGTTVKYQNIPIGSFTGGVGTTPLVIIFNDTATPAAVTALLQNITYQNVSENPSTTPRTVRFVVTDGDGGTSTAQTETINVSAVNDAPIVGRNLSLYNGALGGLPGTQSLSYQPLGSGGTPPSQTFANGITTLDTGSTSYYAGYGTQITAFPLDRTKGYTLNFTVQINSENNTGSDKNGDGVNDRAGFNVITISSDGARGIELGFWQNRIWAQNDGTNQADATLEPVPGTPSTYNRTLFTQGESATFNTTTDLIPYSLTVLGNTYTLSANGNTILTGNLRDYTAFPSPFFPDPYETPNFIFLGDDTPSAQSRFQLSSVSVTANNAFSDLAVNEDKDLSITGVSVFDVDAENNPMSVNLTANNGTLTVNTSGFTGLTATSNTPGNVTLTGTISQIKAALAATNGLVYRGNQDFYGNDILTITANDGVTAGSPKTVSIAINPVNDRPTFNIGANQSVKTGLTQTIAGWARDFNSGAANETQTVAGYIVKVVNDVNADIFDIAPTINLFGDLTYTPKSGITVSKTATIEVQVRDNGGTDNGGVDTSAVQTFKITVNPTTTNSIYGTPNPDTLMGTDQSDRISGLDSDDIIYGGLGSDRIFGDNGNDILYGDLGIIPNSDPKQISDVQPVYGATFSKDDTIAGGLGSDRIYGNLGNDKLYGDEGDDLIWGGEGDDQIWGGYGNDTLYGGIGKDAFVLVRGQGADTIMDFTTEDVLGCAGALKYSSLSPQVQNGDTLIIDTGTNQLLATLNGFTGTVNYGGLF